MFILSWGTVQLTDHGGHGEDGVGAAFVVIDQQGVPLCRSGHVRARADDVSAHVRGDGGVIDERLF